MKRYIAIIPVLILLSTCGSATPVVTQTQTTAITPTFTPVIMVDFFFSARAFLDGNGNGVWDESDTPLEGARMGIRINKEQTYILGDQTGTDGCAQVWAPGGSIDVPFTVRMVAPENSGYILIGESEVEYKGGPSPRFLFRKP